jgi:hypothetical protein
VARIVSAFVPGNKPKAVARWEHLADEADTQQAAQTQLLYQVAVELRSLRMLLTWLLLIIPIIAGVILAVVSHTVSFPTNL